MTIIIGDLHFGKSGFSLNMFQNQINFFNKQLFPFIKKHNIKRVICLGDLFDHRTRQDVNILLKVRNEFLKFFEENEVELIVLMGNHDMYFNNRDVSTLQIFDYFKYLNVIKKPTLVKIGAIEWELFPFLLEGEAFSPKSKYVMGHFEINGFRMAANFKCHDGLETKELKSLNKVLSGHFHIKQESGIVQYLGTPYAMDWSDYNQDRGFYVLMDNGDMEFHINTISKNYYDVKAIRKDDLELKYYIDNKEFSLKEICDLSDNGHEVRINSNETIDVNNSSNIIIDITEDDVDEKDYNNDVDSFVKGSLSENSYKEYSKLYSMIIK